MSKRRAAASAARAVPPAAVLLPAGGITPAAAIAGNGLLADDFDGPSWDRWRAVLKAAHGEALTEAERALFVEVAGDRESPAARVRELWVVAGRRVTGTM